MSRGNRDVIDTSLVKAVYGAGTTRANRDDVPAALGVSVADVDERRDIPTENSPNFMARMREAMSVYLGKRGNPLDRGVTVGDLEAAGIVKVSDGYMADPASFNPISGAGPAVASAYVVDLSPPPSPTGFAAAAAVSNIIVEHDSPSFKQGNGYAKTRLYGATYDGSADLPIFGDATLLTEFVGTVFSYPTDPSTTWRLWLTWETKDGVESTIPAGGINGLQVTTAQNPAKLVEALTGQITASQLYSDLNARIDLIDGGITGPKLPYPLVNIAAAQDALNQRIFHSLNTIGSDLLTNAATINTTAGLVTGAGIYLDSGTGLVKISGLEATNTYLSSVDVRLSAAETSITLKASKTYVDNLVATAVIDPSQIPVFGTLSARLDTAEVNISGLTASVALKAASLDLTATNVRVTTAETNISSLTSSISSKVDSATYTAGIGGLDARLGSAETTISSLGGASSIANIVQQSNQKHVTDNINGETLLRNILNTQAEADARTASLALARSDLTAYVDDGLYAEATARLLLTTTVNGNTASLTSQQTVINGLTAQYMVKLDVNGNVSGYALYQDGSNSQFIISTDQFAVATPASSIPAWAATTAYTTGRIAGITGNTVKMLVCKVAGTSGASAPSIAGAIGSMVQDGSVTWQVASRVPFSIVTSTQTINGVSVAPGMYVDGAMLVNATVQNAQIADLAVDDAKVVNLGLSKLIAGSLTVGQYIRSAAQHVYGGVTDWDWSIDANGLATFNNAVVRGTVYAGAGNIGGNLIDSAGMQSPGYTYGSTGWRLDTSGYLKAFAGAGSVVLDLSATGTASVLKVGAALDLKANGSGTFGGTLDVKSATSGARMEIKNNVIKVYDSSGTLRVQIGDLSA